MEINTYSGAGGTDTLAIIPSSIGIRRKPI
jgi:hypothetical protein